VSETTVKPTPSSYNKQLFKKLLAINFFKRQKNLCYYDYISEKSSKPKCFPFPYQLNHTLSGEEAWQGTLLDYSYIVAGLTSAYFFDRWTPS